MLSSLSRLALRTASARPPVSVSSTTSYIRPRTFSSTSHPAWTLGRLNHVAVATNDLPKSVSLYRDIMGAKVR